MCYAEVQDMFVHAITVSILAKDLDVIIDVVVNVRPSVGNGNPLSVVQSASQSGK